MDYKTDIENKIKHSSINSPDNSKIIEKFVKKNHEKKIIVVQGLGFVGSVMSLVCANALNDDYAVIGVDLPTNHFDWFLKSFQITVLLNTINSKSVKKSKKTQNYFSEEFELCD